MKKTVFLMIGTLTAVTAANAVTLSDLDADGDGMVTFEELTAVLPEISEEVFSTADLNADGMIDEEELTGAQDVGILPAS